MRDVLDFTQYVFRDGFGKPDNPHEAMRGNYTCQTDDWKQFDAFAEDEKLPAPGIPDGRCSKHLIEIVLANIYPYKKIYQFKSNEYTMNSLKNIKI